MPGGPEQQLPSGTVLCSVSLSSPFGFSRLQPVPALSQPVVERSAFLPTELAGLEPVTRGTSSAGSRQPATAFLSFPGSADKRNSRGSGWIRWTSENKIKAGGLGVGAGAGSFIFYGSTAQANTLWQFPFFKGGKKLKRVKKRVLILLSDTGGGHRASADALAAGFQELYGDGYKIDTVDLWKHYTCWPYNALPDTYGFLVKHSFLWRLGYYTLMPRFVHVPWLTAASIINSRRIMQCYDEYKPDLVVSVHPLMQQVPLRVLKMLIRKGVMKPTNFATVVTDLTTCHNAWFHTGVTKCFVATEFAKQRALRMGLQPEQVVVHGLPIRPAFSGKQESKQKLRKQLGLDLDQHTVLLVGGGEGMGPVEKTVKSLAKKVGNCQLVVICGRNKRLATRLEKGVYPEGMRVVVKGFVSDMHRWMGASDCIITKAGPGTIAESLCCGLPILLNNFIPCQEHGNVEFVLSHKVGAFERRPSRISATIRGWFGDQAAEFAEMARRARELAHPDALFRIVEDLAALCPLVDNASTNASSKLVPAIAA